MVGEQLLYRDVRYTIVAPPEGEDVVVAVSTETIEKTSTRKDLVDGVLTRTEETVTIPARRVKTHRRWVEQIGPGLWGTTGNALGPKGIAAWREVTGQVPDTRKGETPEEYAARCDKIRPSQLGHVAAAKLLIASGREV